MGPRIMLEFEHQKRGEIPQRYRVVDKSGYSGSSDPRDTNAVIEKRDGSDAMQQPRWTPAGEEGWIAFMNELPYFTLTKNEPQSAAA